MLYDYSTDRDGNKTVVDKFSGKRVPPGEEQMILALLEMESLKKKEAVSKHEQTIQ
ncbi:hypothetical protein HON36_04400 [Candidatus Parcubacteria bacterium]|jgi:hypothetical protein|nr:hypothetical protein [Candidatus Parcubacteria bacterium]MBT7228477.1 hypothetical protein [Candidatus Parcubacteria bacterium]